MDRVKVAIRELYNPCFGLHDAVSDLESMKNWKSVYQKLSALTLLLTLNRIIMLWDLQSQITKYLSPKEILIYKRRCGGKKTLYMHQLFK